jgi:hypothetical protein
MADSSSRAKKGSVVVQTRSGRLRLQLPRHLYDGDRKYLDLNLADYRRYLLYLPNLSAAGFLTQP